MTPRPPPPVAVGYFPKATRRRPEWLEAPAVEEICSVSECISPGPKDWVQRWLHNELGFYDSEAVALGVAEEEGGKFDVYAYRAFPLVFDGGAVRPWPVPVPEVAIDLAEFALLGYDVVSRSAGSWFECSPLSCYGAARDFGANRFCLLSELEAAYDAAVRISAPDYEPGPYHLLEVRRRNPR